VIHSVANTFGITCIPLFGETQDKTKAKNHLGNSDRNQTCSYAHNLEPIPSFDMFDTLRNSDSSISSFEAPSSEKRYFAHNINSPHKLNFENSRNKSTASSSQVYNKNITANSNSKSAMMCYPTIINDNPWWKEQESCKDHHTVPVPVQEGENPFVAAERRDEREGNVSSSVDYYYSQDNDNDSSRMKPLSLTQESLFTNGHGSDGEDRYIPRGYNDDGPRFDIGNIGKGQKDYDDNGINSNNEDKADEDNDSSSIISSSSSAVFEFFEDVSMMTDEYASVMTDELSLGEDDVFMNEYEEDDDEDEDCLRYCIFEISDDASLLTGGTKGDQEKDADVEVYSLLENDIWEDHRHQQQEEVIDGSTMIDEESKAKISMASKDQVLLDFLVGFCSDKGFSSDDALRWA